MKPWMAKDVESQNGAVEGDKDMIWNMIRIRIKVKSCIRIRIKVKSVRIRSHPSDADPQTRKKTEKLK